VRLSKLAVLEVLLHLDTELVGDALELYTQRKTSVGNESMPRVELKPCMLGKYIMHQARAQHSEATKSYVDNMRLRGVPCPPFPP
jgi:hypothetical protein